MGKGALYSNISNHSITAVGYHSLKDNKADFNTAIGSSALASNTSAQGNTAVGAEALASNQTGANNTAVGLNSMEKNDSGEKNTAIGTQSLDVNESGKNNVAVGCVSLHNLTSGADNVAIGFESAKNLKTGIKNIYIGNESQASAIDVSNEIVIGQGVTGRGADSAVIGNAATESIFFGNAVYMADELSAFAGGGEDAGAGAKLYAMNYYHSSDIRLKENINNNVLGLEIINRLNPVSFKWKNNDSYNQGFIAQEVEEILIDLNINKKQNNIVNTDTQSTFKSLNYSEFIPSLVKAIQEQSAMIESQLTTIESQRATIESQAKRIDAFEARLSQLENP